MVKLLLFSLFIFVTCLTVRFFMVMKTTNVKSVSPAWLARVIIVIKTTNVTCVSPAWLARVIIVMKTTSVKCVSSAWLARVIIVIKTTNVKCVSHAWLAHAIIVIKTTNVKCVSPAWQPPQTLPRLPPPPSIKINLKNFTSVFQKLNFLSWNQCRLNNSDARALTC